MSASTSSIAIGGTNYHYQTSGAADAIVQQPGGSLQFTVHPGDKWVLDPVTANRSEIASGLQIANRTPVHVAYNMVVQSGAVDPNPGNWAVLGQFHQNDGPNTPHNSPPFSIGIVSGKMQVAIGYTDAVAKDTSRVIWSDPNTIVQGATYAMDIKARFDPKGTGHLTVSRNGVTLVEYTGPLGYVSQSSVYWKEGIYRGASNTTMVASYAKLGVVTGATSNSFKPLASSSSANGFELSSRTTDYDASNGRVTGGVDRYVSPDGRQTIEKQFNATGTLLYQQQLGLDGSKTTMTYGSDGVLKQSIALHADGSTDSAQYGLTNQAYVGLMTHQDSTGAVTWRQESFADGSRIAADYGNAGKGYKTKTTYINASGATTRKVYLYLDGSSGTYSFAAGGGLTQVVLAATDGTRTTKTYASNGVIQQLKVAHTDGSKDYTSYNATGVKTTTFYGHLDGSSETDVFAANGALTLKIVMAKDGTKFTSSYASNGVIQSYKVVHTDKSREYTSYDAAGHKTSTYYNHVDGSSETDFFTSNGAMTQKVLVAKNGTKVTDTYALNGSLEEMKMINTDGSRVYMDYNVGGYRSVMTAANAAGATTAVQQVKPDGTAVGKAFAAGVSLVSQAGNDTFTSNHNDTFVFHQGFGHDTISGFNGSGSLRDVLQIDKSVVADFAHLHMTRNGANTVITVSAHDSITLKGVNVSTLSASNFHFV